MPPVMDTDQGVGQYRGTEDWGGEPHLHQHDQAMHTSTDDPRDMSGPEQCSDTSGGLVPGEEISTDNEVRYREVSDWEMSPNTGDPRNEQHSSTGAIHSEQGSSLDEYDGAERCFDTETDPTPGSEKKVSEDDAGTALDSMYDIARTEHPVERPEGRWYDIKRDISEPGEEQCSDTSGGLLPWEERSSDIEVRCLDVSDRKISPNTGDLSKERHSSTGVMHDEQGSSMDESDGTHWGNVGGQGIPYNPQHLHRGEVREDHIPMEDEHLQQARIIDYGDEQVLDTKGRSGEPHQGEYDQNMGTYSEDSRDMSGLGRVYTYDDLIPEKEDNCIVDRPDMETSAMDPQTDKGEDGCRLR